MKRVLAIALILLMTAALFAGCKDDSPMDPEEAVACVLKELNVKENSLSDIHIHIGTLGEATVYNISFTFEGKELTYSVDAFTGEILNIEEGAHSH